MDFLAQSKRLNRLVLATHNKGKGREFAILLAPLGLEVLTAGTLGLPEPEETGTTFAANAILKAEAALKLSGQVALADDSGLCVKALDGKPGIFSARWAIHPQTGEKDFIYAMKRVHEDMGDTKDRSAFFMCVLALAWPDGKTEIFEGRIDGTFIWPPRGAAGHGYDPAFIPEGETRTFAEMSDAEKNRLSHRARAVEKLLARFGA